ncbi:MAG: hypothetical protein COA79_07365 [Planctomycetota bacterium]|nr:MAG: hypothetical protein COA79_07365 [Planctomycetota bacterium]
MSYQFDLKDARLLHLQVSDRILEMIASGGWRKGDQLPSYRDLSQRFEVSYVTIKKAMDHLLSRNLITGLPGKGMFVHSPQRSKKRQLKQIGLVIYCSHQLFFQSDYLMQIFQGIMLEADRIQSNVNIFSIKREGPISPDEFSSNHMDGIIMLSVNNEEYLSKFSMHELPVVITDFSHKKIALDYLTCDNANAAEIAVNELVKHNHKNIAYCGGLTTDTVADQVEGVDVCVESSDIIERRDGYINAMTHAGLENNIFLLPALEFNESSYSKVIEKWMNSQARPTAIITYDTNTAQLLIRAMKKAKIQVPVDVSIVAIAGASNIREDDISINYIQIPFVEMGKESVRALVQRCKKLRPSKAAIKRLPGKWISGNSVKSLI